MIKKARELNIKVMVGSMNESTLGSAAIAHLMPQADYADLDGPLLLDEDIATGLIYNNDGSVNTSNQPGLGIHYTGLYKK
jgi:L-alanine-DL-glutamate epimerase-like enolase superfamily enzyme